MFVHVYDVCMYLSDLRMTEWSSPDQAVTPKGGGVGGSLCVYCLMLWITYQGEVDLPHT